MADMVGCVETVQHSSFDACRSNGPAAAAGLTASAKLSRGPRLKPKKLSGSWKAFDLTAVPIDETDPSTGKFPVKLPYSTHGSLTFYHQHPYYTASFVLAYPFALPFPPLFPLLHCPSSSATGRGGTHAPISGFLTETLSTAETPVHANDQCLHKPHIFSGDT